MQWRTFFINHAPALIAAILIGFLYGAPYVAFQISAGDRFEGAYMLQTANETSYMARIQEIIDGHWLVGSPFHFEYKDQLPLAFPAGEWLYALSVLLLGVSLVSVMIASKFFLPATVTLLVIFLANATAKADVLGILFP